ncbi:hypothetical protein KJ766_00095, partial [Patescibacteria group bacterium]|nr:hypothetical protein [Patescibacteria group bacterium]
MEGFDMLYPIDERLPLEMYQAQQNKALERSRGYLGMSGIGNLCLRAIWYSYRGYTETDVNPWKPDDMEGRKFMIFEMGNRVEDMLVDQIKMAGYTLTGLQDSYEAFNGRFKGHCDGVLTDLDGTRYLLEIKSANNRRFNLFKDKGVEETAPGYWAQIHLYMKYSGINMGLFLILNKDNQELHGELVEYDPKVANKYLDVAELILKSEDPPAGIGKDEKCKDCTFCGYRSWCFGSS